MNHRPSRPAPNVPGTPGAPLEFAPGVYQYQVGGGVLRANVYFVQVSVGTGFATARADRPRSADGDTGPVWVLVDTGVPGCDKEIRAAAETLFGADSDPIAILITHAHPDHVGSAAALARYWRCPVYLHHEEIRMVGGDPGHFRSHSFTLDRWLILPLLRLAGRRHIQDIMERGGLREFALPLGDPTTSHIPIPGLPGWTAIPTPGHTPGHVALFREEDRVLISGDAVVTKPEPFSAMLGRGASVSRSPWYFNWSQRGARDSLLKLAELGPSVLAGGHGDPRAEAGLASRLRALAVGRKLR